MVREIEALDVIRGVSSVLCLEAGACGFAACVEKILSCTEVHRDSCADVRTVRMSGTGYPIEEPLNCGVRERGVAGRVGCGPLGPRKTGHPTGAVRGRRRPAARAPHPTMSILLAWEDNSEF
eukprot:973486-Prymnesium_polylepis.1